MKPKYKVYTDMGDYIVYAASASDAAEQVKHRNWCRVTVTAIERIG